MVCEYSSSSKGFNRETKFNLCGRRVQGEISDATSNCSQPALDVFTAGGLSVCHCLGHSSTVTLKDSDIVKELKLAGIEKLMCGKTNQPCWGSKVHA